MLGETGVSCYNCQLKSLFVKGMLDALFLLYIKLIIHVNKMYHQITLFIRIVAR